MAGKKGCELLRIDRDPFRVLETVRLDARDWGSGVWFSDGDQLGIIAPLRDVSRFLQILLVLMKNTILK